jgi:hypothetical protein
VDAAESARAEIARQLAYRTPNDKPLRYVVIKREVAEALMKEAQNENHDRKHEQDC